MEFAELGGHHSPLGNKQVISVKYQLLFAVGGAFTLSVAVWFRSVFQLQRVCGCVYLGWVSVPSQVSCCSWNITGCRSVKIWLHAHLYCLRLLFPVLAEAVCGGNWHKQSRLNTSVVPALLIYIVRWSCTQPTHRLKLRVNRAGIFRIRCFMGERWRLTVPLPLPAHGLIAAAVCSVPLCAPPGKHVFDAESRLGATRSFVWHVITLLESLSYLFLLTVGNS